MTKEVTKQRKSTVQQSVIPFFTLERALRLPKAILENYAGHAVKPLDLAAALELSPGSSSFRMLCGASSAYGLTEGSYNSDKISLTELGKSIVSPKDEGVDVRGIKAAALTPTAPKSFLEKYNGCRLPKEIIAQNVLNGDFGVPRDSTKQALELILENAKFAGFLKEIKGAHYVDLEGHELKKDEPESEHAEENAAVEEKDTSYSFSKKEEVSPRLPILAPRAPVSTVTRVYISHGKNRGLVPQVKKFLEFGEFTPVISVEEASVSKPVPDKVFDEMRSCQAAIIIIDKEKELISADGNKETVINPNVLIELGAVRALYGNNFVLLVESGITLPSNVQGLYEVRFSGETLDIESAMKILEAFKKIKEEKNLHPHSRVTSAEGLAPLQTLQ